MKKNKIFIGTIVIMLVTLLSKFLGSFRDGLVANAFGGNAISDVYNLAVSVPENLFSIIGLVISTIFIPLLSEVLYKEGKEEQIKFSRNIMTVIFLISVVLFILSLIFTEEIVKIFASGFNGEKLKLSIFLVRIGMINIIFLCLNGIFSSMLQVKEDFIIQGLLGVFFNIPIILYIILSKDPSILGLTISNVLGNAFRVVVQIPSLIKNGYSLKPYLDLKDKRLARSVIVFIPVIIGAGANSINMIVDTNLVSRMGNSYFTALTSAQRILIFANTAISTSIITIMFPVLANKLNSGDKKSFSKGLMNSLTTILLFLIPCGLAFIVLNTEIVRVFIGYGKFLEGYAINITAIALIGYGIQLPFLGMRDILNSCLFTMKKTKITAINGSIGVVINIVLSVCLSRKYGIIGITVSSAIAAAVTAVLMLNSVFKTVERIDLKIFVNKIIKLVVASIVMSFIIINLKNCFYFINNKFIILSILAFLGAVIYFSICKLLKVEEVNDVWKLIVKRI